MSQFEKLKETPINLRRDSGASMAKNGEGHEQRHGIDTIPCIQRNPSGSHVDDIFSSTFDPFSGFQASSRTGVADGSNPEAPSLEYYQTPSRSNFESTRSDVSRSVGTFDEDLASCPKSGRPIYSTNSDTYDLDSSRDAISAYKEKARQDGCLSTIYFDVESALGLWQKAKELNEQEQQANNKAKEEQVRAAKLLREQAERYSQANIGKVIGRSKAPSREMFEIYEDRDFRTSQPFDADLPTLAWNSTAHARKVDGNDETLQGFSLKRVASGKHTDEHTRPHRCKHPDCDKIQGFTYSGGLLRHEREVHNHHGGPKVTHMCPFQGCKRSIGNGFSRKENLNEHIRRVHRDVARSEGGTLPDNFQHSSASAEGTERKRKRERTYTDEGDDNDLFRDAKRHQSHVDPSSVLVYGNLDGSAIAKERYLRPSPTQEVKKSLMNTPWTTEDEQRLKSMRDGGKNWNEIAQAFPSRTEGSVKRHWYKDMHCADFTEDESASLLAAIRDYEANKWKYLGAKLGKPAKACEQYAKEHFSSRVENPVSSKDPEPLVTPVAASVSRYSFQDDRYYYTVKCLLEDGHLWELRRFYESFYDLQVALLEKFPYEAGMKGPGRTIPYMPGPVTHVTDVISNERRESLDNYIKALLTLPPLISKCRLVQKFFTPLQGDLKLDPQPWKDILVRTDEASPLTYREGGLKTSLANENDINPSHSRNTLNNSSQSKRRRSLEPQQISSLEHGEASLKGSRIESTRDTALPVATSFVGHEPPNFLASRPMNVRAAIPRQNTPCHYQQPDRTREDSRQASPDHMHPGYLSTEPGWHHSFNMFHPTLLPQPVTDGSSKPESRVSPDLYELSSDSTSSDSILKSSPNVHNSETDVELIKDSESGSEIDENDCSFAHAEERVLDPGTYFHGLENMEAEVALNSALRYWHPSWISLQTNGEDCNPHRCGTVSSDRLSGSSSPCLPRHLSTYYYFEDARTILEYRNVVARVLANANTMQDARYSAGIFSLLVMDQDRDSVVHLKTITYADIIRLFEAFDRVCEVSVSSANINSKTTVDVESSMISLTTECQNLLDRLCLSLGGPNEIHPSILWKGAVHVIDFALVSYAGAHLEAFDEKYLGQKRQAFIMPPPSDPNIHSLSNSIVLCRRRLQCLDNFLDRQDVWVFCLKSPVSQPKGDTRLLLATQIEPLADIWGPMWKAMRSESGTDILEYNIGNGVIVPWCRPAEDSDVLRLDNNEMYCHWICSKNYSVENVKSHQQGILKKSFNGTEDLLIGAIEVPETCVKPRHRIHDNDGLHINLGCKLSLEDFVHVKNMMRRKGALKEPRTQGSRRYKASHAVQVQGTAMGFVSLANTVTYKRRIGHSMKDTLVERWRHGLRNPVELESYSGVEISLCTQNARRRRLLEILQTETVRKYLSSISFEWINETCKRRYFQSLSDPKSFRRFWKRHPAYRPCVGDAISICLDALQETGINEQNGELSALWVSSFEEEEDSEAEDVATYDKSLTTRDQNRQASTNTQRGCDKDQKARGSNQETSGQPQIPCCDFEAVEEWIVTLFRSEHTWTGFLHDSTSCLTMAVMESGCLDLPDTLTFGRRCQFQSQSGRPQGRNGTAKQQAGFPVLQTALQLNESILKNEGLQCKSQSWDVSAVKKNTRFDLGEQGSLTVYAKASPFPRAPLIMEWSSVKSKKWHELKDVSINEDLLGKCPDKHHQEYIRGKWDVEPLPVLILSKSNKVPALGGSECHRR